MPVRACNWHPVLYYVSKAIGIWDWFIGNFIQFSRSTPGDTSSINACNLPSPVSGQSRNIGLFRGRDVYVNINGRSFSLQWRHNGRDGVSNHQPHDWFTQSFIQAQDQRKHQSSASLAFVPGFTPHKWPVTRKMLPFDDVIMYLQPFIMPIWLPYMPVSTMKCK